MSFWTTIKNKVVGNSVKTSKKYSQGLAKSQTSWLGFVNNFVARYRTVNEIYFEDLNAFLLGSDFGVKISDNLISELKAQARLQKITDPVKLTGILSELLYNLYANKQNSQVVVTSVLEDKVQLVLACGVNGVGKTTSIAKLIYFFQQQNHKILVIPADTYRPAAREQLHVWCQKLNCELFTPKDLTTDPTSILFQALSYASHKNFTLVICDTAGRMHNNANLMAQLAKMPKILNKFPNVVLSETILMLDATYGQNSLSQAKYFLQNLPVNHIFLTKVDISDKTGVIFLIQDDLNLKVKWLGVGEQYTDMVEFNIDEFIFNLFKHFTHH